MSLVGVAPAIDLRRAPLAELRAVDMRAPERDFWADEAALWDRLVSTWAGLDDAAWQIPGASTSDAGGPDWSLAEHVGHLAAWQGLAEVYTQNAIATGRWPSDEELRRRRLRQVQRASPRAVAVAVERRDRGPPGGVAARRSSARRTG